MEQLRYSFIIPVYNRPNEVEELLQSFQNFESTIPFEIVIVEDGSSESSKAVVDQFNDLQISYYFKENSGPGDSRNYGMQSATGDYFIILDSDVILPQNYLETVNKFLTANFYHCFGGPDRAHKSFSNLQKAINFAMTSFLTTGGIRGGSQKVNNFQPRSFNMGLSKDAFLATGGFGKIHPGEDPDLVLRLWDLGYKTTLIKDAFVYHKRRISWRKFYAQVSKFGKVRPILNHWHPTSKRLIYWFPSLFIIGFCIALVSVFFQILVPICAYLFYFATVFLTSTVINKNMVVGYQSVIAVGIQFFGYGIGFLSSSFKLMLSKERAEVIFPKLFFK
jgi:glycosyltransferase involved in cell wall biosynthesis